MPNILIISYEESDLSRLIRRTCAAAFIAPNQLRSVSLDKYDTFVLLGGTRAESLHLLPEDRVALEEQLARGKRLFAEYCRSILDYYFDAPVVSRYERLVVTGEPDLCPLKKGLVLEHQYNARITPFYRRPDAEIRPILHAVEHIRAYREVDEVVKENLAPDTMYPCLWLEQEDRVMYCTFRICNFIRARFAPRSEWKQLVSALVFWICGKDCDPALIESYYSLGARRPEAPITEQIEDAAEAGVDWYRLSGVLLEHGEKGILEGVRSEITPDGKQSYNYGMRADCIGESSLPFWLRYLMYGRAEDLATADALLKNVFSNYLVNGGPFDGMLRWTSEAWTVCYQDDVVRAIFPVLWRNQLTGDAPYYEETLRALDFLVRTTGTDGLRRSRTDNFYLYGDALGELAKTPGDCTSPNYNGYYIAALLLAYRLSGKEIYRETAEKGMTTIMRVYPNLYRIQSETHDVCRLILPLAYLYWVTGKPEHLEWLHRVTDDMEKMRYHGTYLEWDSGYSAELHDAGKNSESAVFSRNGDPITDCLYAVNWLPIAWLHAYCITGDSKFQKRWEDILGFFVKAQIRSDDVMINGAWVRSVDVERMEVGGLPDDVGWGPWCVETGWGMSQIVSGLYMGLMPERFKKVFVKA